VFSAGLVLTLQISKCLRHETSVKRCKFLLKTCDVKSSRIRRCDITACRSDGRRQHENRQTLMRMIYVNLWICGRTNSIQWLF